MLETGGIVVHNQLFIQTGLVAYSLTLACLRSARHIHYLIFYVFFDRLQLGQLITFDDRFLCMFDLVFAPSESVNAQVKWIHGRVEAACLVG